MIKCNVCGKFFKNNLGGNLTIHLLEEHNMNMEDYYVLYELKGIEPKCKCGLCNERPNFYRNKFKDYAINHNSFNWQKNKFIELFGHPKCNNPNCNNLVNFYRGNPRKYCSRKCAYLTEPSRWNQEKVKETINKKYGVNNVFELNEIKEKKKQTNLKKYGTTTPQNLPEFIEKRKKTNIEKYGTPNPQNLPQFIKKKKQTLMKKYGVEHYSKTDKFKENASKNMCKYNENIIINHLIKKYKQTNLYYQSLHEYRFLEYCEQNNLLIFINNSPRFHYLNSNKWHLPDFKFKDKYIIEIKSTYWLKRSGGWDKINQKKISVEFFGYMYITIIDENYEDFFKIL